MTATVLNLTVEAGTTFRQDLQLLDDAGAPVDLTSASARMHVRKAVSTPDPPLLDLTDANGGIVFTAPLTGGLQVVITDTQTSGLQASGVSRAVYDLEVVLVSGDVVRGWKGSITVDFEVTRQ